MTTTTTKMPQPCVVPCPACGGLQCLCRPRFFAGQLLTEEDLNRLERYIVEKNKLHNRHLHGWGVVCGLEVSCHPCQGYVAVKSGYALSPCGDDIVVCQDEAVNVCELIKKCRDDKERQWDCDPAWPRPDPLCGDQDEAWALYICYDEKPSRGVMALRGGGTTCCSRCSCGGSSGCGCGCHEKTNGIGNGCKKPAQLKTPPQCEPTITCEGYNFRLRKLPKTHERDIGELVNRLKSCFQDLTKLQQSITGLRPNQPINEIVAIRNAMLEFLDRHSIYNCDLYQRILRVDLPQPNVTIAPVRNDLGLLLRELLRECICSALLPPSPGPADENCVPIATLTLNCKDGCRVVRICNWEGRRIVVGFPTIEYWFEALLTHSGFSDALVNLCCGERLDFGLSNRDGDLLTTLLAEAAKAEGNVKPQSAYQPLGAFLKGLIANLTKTK